MNLKSSNTDLAWFMAEKWFRLLEISIVLSVINYFNIKTGSVLLEIVYWLSWGVIFTWFRSVGEETIKVFFPKSAEKGRLIRFVIEMVLVVGLFTAILSIGEIITKEQMADRESELIKTDTK